MKIQKTATYNIEHTVKGIGPIRANVTVNPKADTYYGLDVNIYCKPVGGRTIERMPVDYSSVAGLEQYHGRISGSISVPENSIRIDSQCGEFVRGKQWEKFNRGVNEILATVIKIQKTQ